MDTFQCEKAVSPELDSEGLIRGPSLRQSTVTASAGANVMPREESKTVLTQSIVRVAVRALGREYAFRGQGEAQGWWS